jgi:hypothetical protein
VSNGRSGYVCKESSLKTDDFESDRISQDLKPDGQEVFD